jgi:lipoprotein-anchoring transpeptidase ErfK/SrfK
MVQLVAVMLIFVGAAAPPKKQTTPKRPAARHRVARPTPPPTPALPCGDYLSFQVLLDRQNFSPGEIDDRPGPNLTHALTAMQSARNLPVTGEPDCDSWHALAGDQAGALVAEYTVSDADLKGPFEEKIPRTLVEQAKLTALAYRSPIERLGEKFHASPALLQRLNQGTAIAAGATIRVPAVTPFDAAAKPTPDSVRDEISIVVSKESSALRAMRADGSIVFFAPVTTGSEHDPLPIGEWKVTGVQWHPPFHYNPQLFWDASEGDRRATIAPGPNNPVGVVWIDLNLKHYGLHGTPEPGHVGHTESHGCVRLTNWDAVRVAALVKPGTPVRFE